jgi:hypothetical protein
MTDTNIRVITDALSDGGTRTIVIIDGSDPSICNSVNSFLASLLSGAQNPRASAEFATEVKGLAPVNKPSAPIPVFEDSGQEQLAKEDDKQVPQQDNIQASIQGPITKEETDKTDNITMSAGPYKGLRPDEALNKHGIAALTALYDYAKTLSGSEKNAVSCECKKFMAGKLTILAEDAMTRADMISFIDGVSKIAPLDKLAKGYSFQNYKTLCELSKEDELKSYFDTVVQSLQERGSR